MECLIICFFCYFQCFLKIEAGRVELKFIFINATDIFMNFRGKGPITFLANLRECQMLIMFSFFQLSVFLMYLSDVCQRIGDTFLYVCRLIQEQTLFKSL